MARVPTGSEAKSHGISGSVSNQRLTVAGKRALEAHARVLRSAKRLGEELENLPASNGIPTPELDPEDSMVIAMEKVIATAKGS